MAVPRPQIFTIPPHRAFADALAAGLLKLHGNDKTALARGTILLPNNRAARAITDAFVRRAGGGLLLPRLVPLGDPALDERISGALEPLGVEPIPPAIQPVERLMLLAGLVQRESGIGAGEAFRLAADLGRVIDQLHLEGIDPRQLRGIADNLPDLANHWQTSLDRLQWIIDTWPKLLAERNRIDAADRRNRLLDGVARRWREDAPPGFVVAVGITDTAPAVARLLHTIARMERGMVVFPGLDLGMADDEWQSLGPHRAEEGQRPQRSIETHPQFALKLLLDGIGAARGEVAPWRWGGGRDAPAVRSRAIANTMKPPRATGAWADLPAAERRLTGIRALELADPAEESQAIALALRQTIETPGRTAALVTPDRALARRVSAHLKRWNILADDSAGRPLSETAPGALLLGLAAAAVERFAPVPLLSVLKHPLIMTGPMRPDWLEGARALDRALRGPRPPAGLTGLDAYLAERPEREAKIRAAADAWWRDAGATLRPLENMFEAERAAPRLTTLLAALREAASNLTLEQIWTGPAGLALADLFADLEAAADAAPRRLDLADLVPLLRQLMDGIAIRPPYGQHPRIFIWGLIEARLQQADLMILSGLNEGTWPALPAPDPWLAPQVRLALGLPGLERRIGVAAHDFASALGGREVLITRARRDARAPAIASRFWLRLEAMTGGMTRATGFRRWAAMIDASEATTPARRPAPSPPLEKRPKLISVTEVDRLKADPFAFYARRILGLYALDPVDADPSAAWRGTQVHAILEAWMRDDDCDPAKLRKRAESLLADAATHPLMRALWQPRLLEATDWIAATMAENLKDGRRPIASEAEGQAEIGGVTLKGIADRIDRAADNSLAIVDYKTGQPPSAKAVAEGFSLQLGLLGLIAEHGGFDGIEGVPAAFEYWSLARGRGGTLGFVAKPTDGKNGVPAAEFTKVAANKFLAEAKLYLTGSAPFVAQLHPEYAPYGDYDQLMRLEEWYGREGDIR